MVLSGTVGGGAGVGSNFVDATPVRIDLSTEKEKEEDSLYLFFCSLRSSEGACEMEVLDADGVTLGEEEADP